MPTAVRRGSRWSPPYLLTAVTNRLGVGVGVTGDAGMAVVEVAPYGPWSPHLGEQVSAALRMCLASPSASIIVDLHDLGDPYGVSLLFWLALWREARFAIAPVRVMFCLPTTTALSRHFRYLQGPQPRVFATLPEARIAIAERMPGADRLRARLEPRPASIRVARTLVTQACHGWHLQELLQDAWLIVPELAANVVEHACTDFIVTVSRSGSRLHVVVHDWVSRFPRLSEPELVSPRASLDERGRGLWLVNTVAAAWGAMSTCDGKVVWATMM